MPIEQSFHPSEAMLSPSHVAPVVEGFPETVLITFSDHMERILKETHEVQVISSLRAGDTRPIHKFTHKGKLLGMYRTGLGGSASAALMEEVIAKGAKRILVFGSCGVLKEGIAAGHLILPTAAFRDEGTSYHYLPADDFVSVPTHDCLKQIFDALGVPTVSGKTWTTDGFYRETKAIANKRLSQGCICVEMECASLMAVGAFRHIPVYQFLYAADSLSGSAWEKRILGAMTEDMRETILQIALDAAAQL